MEEGERKHLFESIQSYLFHSHKIRNGSDFCKCLDFMANAPRYAPFNNFLVYLQNSKAEYFAEERIWQKFGRSLSPNAQPLLILWPFSGPVRLIFDARDTEGLPILKEGFLHWWSNDTRFDEQLVRNTELFLEMNEKQAVERGIPTQTGAIDRSDSLRDRYATICRSLGYYLMGHGGAVPDQPSAGHSKLSYVRDRSGISLETKELECDALVWLIHKRLGLYLDSAEFMEGPLRDTEVLREISIPDIARAAGRIERAGARKPSITKRKSKKEERILPGIPLPGIE